MKIILTFAVSIGTALLLYAQDPTGQQHSDMLARQSSAAQQRQQQGNSSNATASRGYIAPKGTWWDYPDPSASKRYKKEWKEAHAARKEDKANRKASKRAESATNYDSETAEAKPSKSKAKSKVYRAQDNSQYPDGKQPKLTPERKKYKYQDNSKYPDQKSSSPNRR